MDKAPDPHEAFEAIQEVALKLMKQKLPADVESGLELIISLTRYQFDVRTEAEKQGRFGG